MRECNNIYSLIDHLKIGQNWKRIFKKIQVSYYQNFYQGKRNNIHLWRYNQMVMSLSPEDRFNFFTRFNLAALIFGPLYYIYKFILPKALILLLIEIGLIYYSIHIYNPIIGYLCILVHIYACIFANTDYFSKMVLNNKLVKENPDLLSDVVDDNFVKTVVKEQSPYYFFVFFVTLALLTVFAFFFVNISKRLEYQNILKQASKVCAAKSQCSDLIVLSIANIRDNNGAIYKQYFNLGAAQFELGNKQAALEAVNHAISSKDDYLPAYIIKGAILTEYKQFDLAAATYEKAIKIYPEAKLFFLLGSMQYKEGKFVQAAENFKKAVRANSNEASYYEALAYSQIYLRDTKSAKNSLMNAVKVLRNQGEAKNSARIERIESYMKGLK